MLKKYLEEKLREYELILKEIGRWANPQQYGLNELTPHSRLLFHIRGIRKIMDEKFYKVPNND